MLKNEVKEVMEEIMDGDQTGQIATYNQVADDAAVCRMFLYAVSDQGVDDFLFMIRWEAGEKRYRRYYGEIDEGARERWAKKKIAKWFSGYGTVELYQRRFERTILDGYEPIVEFLKDRSTEEIERARLRVRKMFELD